MKLIAIFAALLLVAPIFADTNVTLMYVYNGTGWTPLASSSDGTLQVNPNITISSGINPKTNNTYSIGSANLQWSSAFATNVRSAGPTSIYAGGTEKITVLADGKTGIGNTNPGQTLAVSGQANVTGTLISNGTMNIRSVAYNWPSSESATQYLMTNGAGGLSWNTPSTGGSNISARNVTAGSFGADVGGGSYSFPNNISVGANLSASDRITDKTGFVMPVGAILAYTDPIVPAGWLIANGSEVNRTTYPDLFNITGTRYGNTTDSTFKLPNLKQRFVLGVADTGTGSTLGGTGGGIDHTHTGPSHTHTYSTVISHTHTADPPSTASDSQGSHTHTFDPLSVTSDSQGSHTHTADPPNTGLSISDPGHSHDEKGNSLTFVGGGGSFTTGSLNSVLSESTGSGTTGITASDVDIALFATASGGGHSHTLDLAAVTSSSNGGHTHSTDIASFTSGSTGSASGTSDAGGTGASGTGNPPFIALYYIIKY